MPLFEYSCDDCGMVFSEFRSSAERDNPLDCPNCDSDKVSRKMSTFACSTDASGSASAGGSCIPQGGFS